MALDLEGKLLSALTAGERAVLDTIFAKLTRQIDTLNP